MSKNTSGTGTFLGILTTSTIISVALCCGMANLGDRAAPMRSAESYEAAGSISSMAPAPAPAPYAASTPKWEYNTIVDPMTQKAGQVAALTSSNTLSLGFPYQGEQHAYLAIRENPRSGNVDVFVKIEQGQILCRSYMSCAMNVTFGNGEMQQFSGAEAADHDSTIAFITNSKRFVAQAQKSETILIELMLYKEGSHVMRFESDEPLVWK